MKNRNYEDRKEHGAFPEDLWRLYRLAPEVSVVQYDFYPDDKEPPADGFHVFKYEVSDRQARRQLDGCLERFGPGPYRVELSWWHGFGNNFVVSVRR